MKKHTHRIAALLVALSLCLSLCLAGPGLALADEGTDDHGPMPIAIIGTIFGGAMWLVSTPFVALIAPTHIEDSFDAMVAAPWRATIGDND